MTTLLSIKNVLLTYPSPWPATQRDLVSPTGRQKQNRL